MCGCLFALFAGLAPRLALLFMWLLTDLVDRVFDTFVVPLLGLIFLPYTTLMYILVYNPVVGVSAWGWFWVALGVLADISKWYGVYYSNRQRAPAAYQ
ncbi:MAG: hypothetical protein GTO18_20150 [Anaerolineales bacterium]|nr:hypothetical protein [Anaerolineales bacterium]